MVQGPTGSGKTKQAAHIIKGARAKGKRCAFVVPMISLIDQAYNAFVDEGIDPYPEMSIVQSDHPFSNMAAPVQVCSQATLTRRYAFPDADIVIIDEAHVVSRFVYRWMVMKPDTLFIGLSATPWTKGLGKHYDKLIVCSTTQELIDEGYLSPFRVFAPSAPDLQGIKTILGDFDKKELGKRVSNKALVADTVSTYLEKAVGLSALCYAANRAHAKQLQGAFLNRGVSAGYIDARTSLEDREVIRKQFHSGDIKVVCNVGCLTTGVDWDVRCIILARPTKSEMLFTQMIGRGLRTAEGKDECLILDHSDTHNRLGFVTDIHHTHLDMGRTGKKPEVKKKEILPKPCPKCSFMKTERKCPECGFITEPQSNVTTKSGKLVELKKKPKYTNEEAIEIWRMFLWIANEKGYKAGWAKYSASQMTKSSTGMGSQEQPLEPSEKVRKYAKYLQIKNAKSRSYGK